MRQATGSQNYKDRRTTDGKVEATVAPAGFTACILPAHEGEVAARLLDGGALSLVVVSFVTVFNL